LLKINLRFF